MTNEPEAADGAADPDGDGGASEESSAEASAETARAEPADAWREALTTRKTREAPGQTVPGAGASRPSSGVSRRRFVRGSFWTGLGVTMMGAVGGMVDLLYPRNVAGFGGPVAAGNVADYPVGGEPKHFLTGQFFIANLDPNDSGAGGSGGGSGLLALWRKCPHLGCAVPWRKGFNYLNDQGWYRCPCHGSTYTRAGVRVYGPAPRPLDTMRIEVDGDGNITVHTGDITSGADDNPKRAGAPYWGGPVADA